MQNFIASRPNSLPDVKPVLRRMLAMAALTLLILGITPLSALAEGETVSVQLRYEDQATGERVPVEGAAFVVRDDTGATVAEGTTDADGRFEAPLPGPGSYQLELDPTTLPEGIVLRDATRSAVTVNIEEGQSGAAIFGLNQGEVTDSGSGITLRQVAQLTVEGIKFGLFLGMAAIGLSLIFGTTGLVNFAHGEMIGWGMLVAYLFNFYGLAGEIARVF